MMIGEGEPGSCELGGSELGGSDDAGGGETNGGMPLLSSIFTSAPAYTVEPAAGTVVSTLPRGWLDVTFVGSTAGLRPSLVSVAAAAAGSCPCRFGIVMALPRNTASGGFVKLWIG